MTKSADQQELDNLLMVIGDGMLIRYIKNPSEEVQLAAVRQNGLAIQCKCIQNPSEAVQKEALKQNTRALYYIKDPSEEMQLDVIKRDGHAIQCVKNQSEAVQLAALNQDPRTVWRIKNPSKSLQMMIVVRNPFDIAHIKNPSEAVQLAAMNQNINVINQIKDPTEKIRLMAFVRLGPVTVARASGLNFITPSALEIAESFKRDPSPFNFSAPIPGTDNIRYQKGLARMFDILRGQPSADILILAEAAPGLFENNVLTEILRDALQAQAAQPSASPAKRSM